MGENNATNAKLIAAVLVAILGGNAGGVINAYNPGVRADPCTGSQCRGYNDRIGALEKWVLAIREEQVENSTLIRECIRHSRDL